METDLCPVCQLPRTLVYPDKPAGSGGIAIYPLCHGSLSFRTLKEAAEKRIASLISADALSMLLATSAAFFSMALNSYRRGVPEAPSKDKLQATQNAIAQAVSILG